MDRLAGVFGKGADKPIAADEAGLPPPGISTAGALPVPAQPVAQPEAPKADEKADDGKKKRGFWARLFGTGKDDTKKDDKKKKPGGG